MKVSLNNNSTRHFLYHALGVEGCGSYIATVEPPNNGHIPDPFVERLSSSEGYFIKSICIC